MKLLNPYTKTQYDELLVQLTDEERRLVEQTSSRNCSGWYYINSNTLNLLKEIYSGQSE